MDKIPEEKLRDFEKLWQRVNAARDLTDLRPALPLKLMPKKEKKGGLRRYIPYSP